ncbi:MAG TPA: UbiA family prenyltransferase [Luteolibacter sp.]|nr:UbiA family prenyltransferase [Luteolibacter sp.]
MSHPGKFRALLATARIANVPSVVSNVWVGIAVAAAFQRWEYPGPFLLHTLLLCLSGICLYIAGNFLNDWHDRDWDAKNRPERALPSGLFAPGKYLLISIILGLIGLASALIVSVVSSVIALIILILIVIYTRWHKRAVWAVIPMGLCRAFLPIMGFSAFAAIQPLLGAPVENTIIVFHATALLIYIAALSLGARYESSANPSKTALLISKSALVFSGILAAAVWASLSLRSALIGLIPFAVWMTICLTRYRRPIPVHVSALLAGIPLLDAIALLAYTRLQPPLSYPPALQPYLLACIFIPFVAFFLGRLLQRVAPAT